ncbi:MAG TPA: ATP-binding protein [Gammaproteobacteria bacterium]|nr:ATP-binding protein [Gammaproteobacteria bacterium]
MGLFWKIFMSFMVAMTVTLVGTVYVSFRLANQLFDQALNVEGRAKITDEAAAALSHGGERGLKIWLNNHLRIAPGIVLYVMNERGDELLGRAMPRELFQLLRTRPFRPQSSPPPSNLRPMQLTSTLIGPNDEEYRLLFARAPSTFLGLLTWPGTPFAVISIAVLATALMALLLARYLSSPIARLQKASLALAAGALDARVGQPFTRRKDEVGRLARDFDKMAERIQALVTDKETLLRDVSHELRSPLARIRMALALAQRRANQAAQPDLERIEREAERLDALVGQVMTLTRLRTATEPRRDVVRLDTLVAEVVDDARYEHPKTKVEYSTSGEVSLLGDPDGLKSAVENVVRNALIYSDPAQLIEVRLEAKAGEAAVRVLDRGPGVAPEDLAKIFEPFYRTDQSRDHRQDGQGIGLAITARVTELHHGSVRALNRPDGGLEVVLKFPLDRLPEAA